MMPYRNDITYCQEIIELKKMLFHARGVIDPDQLRWANATYDFKLVPIFGYIEATLSAELYGRTASHTVEYPANWKEAFKLAHFPQWLLKRYPVKYTKVVVDAGNFATKLDIPENYGPYFRIMTVKTHGA